MNQNTLRLIRSGSTAELADAVHSDPALASWRDSQGVSALMWSIYAGQTMARDFLLAELARQAISLDVFEASATTVRCTKPKLATARATAPMLSGLRGRTRMTVMRSRWAAVSKN